MLAVEPVMMTEAPSTSSGSAFCTVNSTSTCSTSWTTRILSARSLSRLRDRKLGRTDEGTGYYLKSVALDPNYPQVREYLGEAYVIEGKYDLAKEQLSTIEKLCSKDCEYYEDLAGALTEAHAL
jgi:tetratricopeptide (TPR) repeat protein